MDSASLKVPGFGLPINHRFPQGEYFPSAIYDVSHNYPLAQRIAITLRELKMLRLMDTITDKPEWESKVFDNEFIRKWSEEAHNAEGMDVTDKMLDYVSNAQQANASWIGKFETVLPIMANVLNWMSVSFLVSSNQAVNDALSL